MSNLVCVGVIVGAHGVRGAVRIKSFTEVPADMAVYGPVSDETGKLRYRLTLLGESKGVVLAELKGVSDRNAAEALKGMKLWVERSALPPPDEEEFYYSDLVGLRAELADGTEMGRVKGVFDFGGGDVVEIAGPQGSVMLPFTRAAVPLVDVAGGRLVVEPPEEIEGERRPGASMDAEKDGGVDGDE